MANYRDSNTTLSWGTDSYALADAALAVGRRSVANADVSIASGERSAAYARWSNALGGKGVRTLGDGSLATNVETTAGGERSTAGNFGSVTGGWPYAFTFETVTTDAQVSTECEAYVTTEGTCMASSTVSMLQDAASKDVLVVSASEVARARLSSFDVKIGDMVCIYDLSYVKDGVTVECTDDAGYTNRLFSARVTAVSSNPGGGYRITLDSPVPSEYSGAGSLAGGKIATYMRGGVSLGQDSVALNHYTVAAGDRQTVAGSSNVPSLDARFIVGVGSSYIETDGRRANGLLIGEDYGYMKLADGTAMVGISGDDGSSGDSENVNLFKGAFMQAGSALDGEGITRLNVRPTYALMSSYIMSSGSPNMYADFGIANSLNSLTSVGSVTSLLRSYIGASIVASGNINGNNLVDYMLNHSDFIRPVPSMNADNSVGIYAEKNIEIRSIGNTNYPEDTGINIQTESGLHQTFMKLYLSGDTYGALTATDTAKSFQLRNNGTASRENTAYNYMTAQSGFFHSTFDTTDENQTSVHGIDEWPNDTSVHSINSTVLVGSQYETASIAIPGTLLENNTKLMHPVVTVGRYAEGDRDISIVATRELAFLDDLSDASRISKGSIGAIGYERTDPTNDTPIKDGRLPVMVRVGNEWKGTLDDVQVTGKVDITGNPRTWYSSTLDIGLTDGHQLGTIEDFQYILVDQYLSVDFVFKNKKTSGTNISGFMLPLMIGCGVEQISRAEGQYDIAGGSSGQILRYNVLNGTGSIRHANSNSGVAYADELHASASVFTTGFMLLVIEMPNTSHNFINNLAHRVHISGRVPFKASVDGCSENSSIRNSSIISNTTKQNFSYADWCTTGGDNIVPDTLGVMFSVFAAGSN